MALPQGPTSLPVIQTARWILRPLSFLRECQARYGDSFTIKLQGSDRPMVMITDPVAIKALYAEPAHGIPPGRNFLLEPLMGPRSLFLMEGDEHLSRRRLMLPPFHGERMRAFGPLIEEVIRDDVDSWPLDEPFAIHSRAQAVTLEVILRAVFGVADASRRRRLAASLTEILEGSTSSLVLFSGAIRRSLGVSVGPWRRFESGMRQVDELVYAEIEARRSDPNLEEYDDFLSMLLQARFEDGEPMDDSELRDQLMTLLVAGHETTATALAWTFDLLLGHPEKLRRLRESLLDGKDDYLNATVTESLRLRPLVPHTGRRLNKELSVEGLTLPAGTDITPAIWLTHTRADVYPEPFVFRPERFLEDGPETYSWIPFGGGVRRCLGAPFSEFEIRAFVREVISRCDLHKANPRAEQLGRRGATLSPRDGTPVVVTARRALRGVGELVPA